MRSRESRGRKRCRLESKGEMTANVYERLLYTPSRIRHGNASNLRAFRGDSDGDGGKKAKTCPKHNTTNNENDKRKKCHRIG